MQTTEDAGGRRAYNKRWTEEETAALRQAIEECGGVRSSGINWSSVAESLPGRTGKQCREKWKNDLRPDISKTAWTALEEYILVRCHCVCGNQWSDISRRLPGRSENNIKNHWNSTLRSKTEHKQSTLLWIYAHMVKESNGSSSLDLLHQAVRRYTKQTGFDLSNLMSMLPPDYFDNLQIVTGPLSRAARTSFPTEASKVGTVRSGMPTGTSATSVLDDRVWHQAAPAPRPVQPPGPRVRMRPKRPPPRTLPPPNLSLEPLSMRSLPSGLSPLGPPGLGPLPPGLPPSFRTLPREPQPPRGMAAPTCPYPSERNAVGRGGGVAVYADAHFEMEGADAHAQIRLQPQLDLLHSWGLLPPSAAAKMGGGVRPPLGPPPPPSSVHRQGSAPRSSAASLPYPASQLYCSSTGREAPCNLGKRPASTPPDCGGYKEMHQGHPPEQQQASEPANDESFDAHDLFDDLNMILEMHGEDAVELDAELPVGAATQEGLDPRSRWSASLDHANLAGNAPAPGPHLDPGLHQHRRGGVSGRGECAAASHVEQPHHQDQQQQQQQQQIPLQPVSNCADVGMDSFFTDFFTYVDRDADKASRSAAERGPLPSMHTHAHTGCTQQQAADYAAEDCMRGLHCDPAGSIHITTAQDGRALERASSRSPEEVGQHGSRLNPQSLAEDLNSGYGPNITPLSCRIRDLCPTASPSMNMWALGPSFSPHAQSARRTTGNLLTLAGGACSVPGSRQQVSNGLRSPRCLAAAPRAVGAPGNKPGPGPPLPMASPYSASMGLPLKPSPMHSSAHLSSTCPSLQGASSHGPYDPSLVPGPPGVEQQGGRQGETSSMALRRSASMPPYMEMPAASAHQEPQHQPRQPGEAGAVGGAGLSSLEGCAVPSTSLSATPQHWTLTGIPHGSAMKADLAASLLSPMLPVQLGVCLADGYPEMGQGGDMFSLGSPCTLSNMEPFH